MAAPSSSPSSSTGGRSGHLRTRSGGMGSAGGDLKLTGALIASEPMSPRTPGGGRIASGGHVRVHSRGGMRDDFDIGSSTATAGPSSRARGLSNAGVAAVVTVPPRIERSASLPLVYDVPSGTDELVTAANILQGLLNMNDAGALSKDDTDMKIRTALKLIKRSEESVTNRLFNYESRVVETLSRRRSSLQDTAEIEVVDWLQNEYLSRARRGSTSSSGASSSIGVIPEEQSFEGGSVRDLIEEVESAPKKVVGRARGTSRAMRPTTASENKTGKEYRGDPVRELGLQLVTSPVMAALAAVNTWDWDVFQLEAVAEGRPLSLLVYHLLETLDVFDKFKLSRTNFVGFITAVEEGYMNNPYHNAVHAADVVANMYFFLRSASLSGMINTADVFAGLLAAAIHDYAHPGTNNGFQIATESDLALKYNDRAVLENMHLSEAFHIMKQDGCNPFHGLSPEIRKQLRGTMIAMVLATDMSHHFELISQLNSAIETKRAKKTWFDHNNPADRLLCAEAAMHCSDLGNPSKPRDCYLRWVTNINEEFWQQGDEEKRRGLPISLMCDRTKPNIERSQIGFIDHIVKPLYQIFSVLCPEVKVCLDNMDANRSYFEDKLKRASAAGLTSSSTGLTASSTPAVATPTPAAAPATVTATPSK